MAKKPVRNKKIAAGIIGCGMFANSVDFSIFKKHPDVELKWACDLDIKKAQASAAQWGVPKVTTDYNEVVSDPDVKLIKISTTPHIHLPITQAAAQHGVAVFCEKPMATNIEDTWRLVQTVKKSGIKFTVDHMRTHAPAVIAWRNRFLEHKKNPKHHSWRCKRANNRPIAPDELGTQLLLRCQDDSASYAMGHHNPLISQNKFYREMTHFFDLACWFYKPQRPVRVLAWGSERFSSGTWIEFSEGDIANIIFDCGGTFDYPKETFEVAHNGAFFRSLYFVENEYYGAPGPEGEKFPLRTDSFPNVGKEGGFSGYMAKHRAYCQGRDSALQSGQVDKGHYNLLDALVKSIQNDTVAPSNEMDGLASIYLADLATMSLRLQQAVPVAIDKLNPVFYEVEGH